MFVCNYDRKKFVVDYRQKYVEITKKCLWIKIADERLRFLQTKHLQCSSKVVELGGQDEFYFLMIMLHFNHYINTLASDVKYNPTHENYARFL